MKEGKCTDLFEGTEEYHGLELKRAGMDNL